MKPSQYPWRVNHANFTTLGREFTHFIVKGQSPDIPVFRTAGTIDVDQKFLPQEFADLQHAIQCVNFVGDVDSSRLGQQGQLKPLLETLLDIVREHHQLMEGTAAMLSQIRDVSVEDEAIQNARVLIEEIEIMLGLRERD